MSLINDALKRAKQVQPDPSQPAASSRPMEPVHYPRQGLPWFFIPAVLAILAGGGWFMIRGWDAHRQSAAGYGKPMTVKAREPANPIGPDTAAPREPVPELEKPPANNGPAVAFTAVNRNFSLDDSPTAGAESPATPAAAAPTTTTPAPDTAPGPTFKLQGIFYRNANPSAMVNGKSVNVGDRVSGARILAIDRDRVTLEYEGQTKTLTLE